jgi:hypothetical protein
MHRLIPAERVTSIRLSYPHLKVSEALASSSFFDVAKDQPKEGWVQFELNEPRVLKVCESGHLFFEAVVSAANKTDRAKTLVRLRHEIFNLIFDVDQPGTLIPWVYTVTPSSINIAYQDPRHVEKLPGEFKLSLSERQLRNLEFTDFFSFGFSRWKLHHLRRNPSW